MPYRADIPAASSDALDVLVRLGALDIEQAGNGLAAILPDDVRPETVARVLGGVNVITSAATPRDSASVWLIRPRAVRIGSILVRPSGVNAQDALVLVDSSAFGTGHHPTTALCIEILEEIVSCECPSSVLDVGTGSGILALAALMMNVPQAVGVDIDAGALQAAAENARLNGLDGRLRLVHGGPDAVEGTWPLILANVLAAPLIEMAPFLVRLVASRGRVVLSGIPWSLEAEVRRAYQHLGMRHVSSQTRGGWTAIVAQASW